MGSAAPPIAIGVDVGGSGIKAAMVDVTTGQLAGQRLRLPTPEPSVPQAVIESMAELLRRLCEADAVGTVSGAHASGSAAIPCPALDVSTPVGVGFPAPVIAGVTKAAANVDPGWVDYAAENELRKRLGRPVAMANDADLAGIAEMRFGAGRGVAGTVMVLTIGTGIGSAIFVDGRLLPNTELGHLQVRGKDAEKRASDAARARRLLTWPAWARLLDEYLLVLQQLFYPDLFILGGGVSKRADRFLPRLAVKVPVVPATLLNDAGIVGAAVVARERFPEGLSEPRVTRDRGPRAGS